MTKHRHLLLLSFVFIALTSCDFENKIRRLVSDPSGRKRDSLKQDEVSSTLSESEPNETSQSASSLLLTKEMREISGEFKGSDLFDWFDVKVPNSEEYEVSVRPSSTLDVALFLEDNTFAFNVGKEGTTESFQSKSTNRLRFGIKRENKSEGTYSIKIAKIVSGTRTGQAQRIEKEPNNNTANAGSLDLGVGLVGRIEQVGDRDVFRLSTSIQQRWELQFIPTKGELLTIKFCQDLKLESCSNIYDTKNGTLTIPSFGNPSKDKDLFLVVGSQGVSSNYQILGRLIPLNDSEALSEIEPNDTFPMEIDSQLEEIRFGGTLAEGDVDRFRVLGTQEYSIGVVVNDPDLTISANGVLLNSRAPYRSCSKKSDDEVELKFLKRRDSARFSGQDYQIDFLRRGENAEQEPNQNNEQAQVSGEKIFADTSAKDPDHFIFNIDGKEVYQVENYASQNLIVSIQDDEGFDVLAPQKVSRREPLRLKFDFPKGKYFVRVLGESSMCAPYQISKVLVP